MIRLTRDQVDEISAALVQYDADHVEIHVVLSGLNVELRAANGSLIATFGMQS